MGGGLGDPSCTSDGVDISVVIPCRNGAGTLGAQLDALLAQQTGATFEVIVADNGSTDATAELVRRYGERDPRVKLVDASRAPGANVGRNVGVRAARGRFILLTDADDLVHPGWIEAYWQAFSHGAHSAGGALIRVLAGGKVLSRESRLYRPLAGRGVTFANATNCGFSAAAFHRVGGFDESFIGGADEVDFYWRLAEAGYELVLVPEAKVDKLMHTDLDDAFRQQFNFGRGETRLMQKFRPRLVTPLTLLALCGVVVWFGVWATVARLTPRWRRHATNTVAWNLGFLTEAVRLRSGTGHSAAQL
ncbi:MAG: glycosyltransferase [Mycobacterium sp.]|nr:glycosyltransferase [Mycobacterium sp.]